MLGIPNGITLRVLPAEAQAGHASNQLCYYGWRVGVGAHFVTRSSLKAFGERLLACLVPFQRFTFQRVRRARIVCRKQDSGKTCAD